MRHFGIIVALTLMLFGFVGKASAQFLPDVPDMKGKMIYGGNLGGGMYGNYLSVSIAPQVGYRIFSPWEVGLRTNYHLMCYFDRYYGNEFRHYFGIAPYTNFQVYKGIFLHAEDELMYGFARWNHETVSSKWYNSVFAGLGYRQYSYSGSFVYFLVLYNLSWDLPKTPEAWDTPYSSPIELRVGYCF